MDRLKDAAFLVSEPQHSSRCKHVLVTELNSVSPDGVYNPIPSIVHTGLLSMRNTQQGRGQMYKTFSFLS
jgi:hypothetical protein